MTNIVEGNTTKEFYVWLDPENPIVKLNIKNTGMLQSLPNSENTDHLPFIANSSFDGFMTPFTYNIMEEYRIEYNYELTREKSFPNHPSRLASIFLFENKEDAIKYQKTHGHHVHNRKLIKVVSVGDYKYSIHDIGWTDALYMGGGQGDEFREFVMNNYWKGNSAKGQTITSFGKEELLVSNNEILYLGKVHALDEL